MVGVVEGGLAGITYRYKDISIEWKEVIVKREYLEIATEEILRNSIDMICEEEESMLIVGKYG